MVESTRTLFDYFMFGHPIKIIIIVVNFIFVKEYEKKKTYTRKIVFYKKIVMFILTQNKIREMCNILLICDKWEWKVKKKVRRKQEFQLVNHFAGHFTHTIRIERERERLLHISFFYKIHIPSKHTHHPTTKDC